MLKEVIRQLASSTEKMTGAMHGNLQLAGVSAAEQKALLGELNNSEKKGNGYSYLWD